jgi:hypothetical protein
VVRIFCNASYIIIGKIVVSTEDVENEQIYCRRNGSTVLRAIHRIRIYPAEWHLSVLAQSIFSSKNVRPSVRLQPVQAELPEHQPVKQKEEKYPGTFPYTCNYLLLCHNPQDHATESSGFIF